MFDAILEGFGYVLFFFFLSALFFLPLWIGVIFYSIACAVYRYVVNKRGINISTAKNIVYHAIFLLVTVIVVFLVGITSFDIEEVLAWDIIPGLLSYLSGVGIYHFLVSNEITIDDESDEKLIKRKRRIRKLGVFIVGVLVFVFVLMIGISFVPMTLM